MTKRRILVLNPASNPDMTRRIDSTAMTFSGCSDFEIVCETLADGPKMVASNADVDLAAVATRRRLAQPTFDLAIIACYADPGLYGSREITAAPVLGVGRCAALTALARSDNFGVIAMTEAAIPRHLRALRQAGLERHLAGERALPPLASHDSEAMFERMTLAGRALRDENGATAVVIGCAEFGALRGRLERALEVPVIDPVEAAIGMAIGILAQG